MPPLPSVATGGGAGIGFGAGAGVEGLICILPIAGPLRPNRRRRRRRKPKLIGFIGATAGAYADGVAAGMGAGACGICGLNPAPDWTAFVTSGSIEPAACAGTGSTELAAFAA